MNDPQPIDIRRRIRELLAIPDRDRTDAEWDELNELEIRTAPGNRDSGYPSDRTDGKKAGGFGQGRRQGYGKKPGGQQRAEPRAPMPDARPDGVAANRPEGQGQGQGQGRLTKRQHRRPRRPHDSLPPQGNPDGNSGA